MVKAWMLQTQIGRRNLRTFQKIELAATRENLIRQMACRNMTTGGGDQKSGFANSRNPIEQVHTDEEIAKLARVSINTVYRTRVITNSGTPEQLDRVRVGGKGNSINAIYRGS